MTIIEALVKLRNDLKLWVANNLRTKVDKIEGMGLSSNDFTSAEKEKLSNLSSSFVVTFNQDDVSTLTNADFIRKILSNNTVFLTRDENKQAEAGAKLRMYALSNWQIDGALSNIIANFISVEGSILHKCQIAVDLTQVGPDDLIQGVFTSEEIQGGGQISGDLITIEEIDEICGAIIEVVDADTNIF